MALTVERETFLSPPNEIRPAPFWFWNDHLDPERLIWQYDRFIEAGMGGACIHARSGLESEEYLDERWFAAVTAVVEHAAKRGTIIWLYDELGWPSGTAGGRVLREHPELGAVQLAMRDITPQSADELADHTDSLVAAFCVTKTDPLHGTFVRNDRGTPLPGSITLLPDRIEYEPLPLPLDPSACIGERLLLFRVGGGGGLNYLDKNGAKAFLRSTHEEYYKRYSEHFGSTITHSFMDEAGMFAGASGVPWTHDFAERFADRNGYAIAERLPDLFFDVSTSETTRYDFWSLAADMFREGFGVPLNEWCNEHGIKYSGHYVFETTLKEATRELGSTMPLYEHQGLPGIDILGNDFYSLRFSPEDYGFYSVMVKQAASVSHQLDLGGLMSESHGVGGHALGPEGMQTVNNFQMALGVTFVAQHAPFYSIRGKRKLDHPPIIGWQQPYWPFVKKHMDTTSRTGWLLGQGQHVSDVLVIHPSASMQSSYRHFRAVAEHKAENYVFDADMPFEFIDKHINLLTCALLDAQIDFDFGDDVIMSRHAAIEDDTFKVGQMRYRIVVMPPSTNVRSTTLTLLREFAEAGGKIFVLGSAPHLVDGRPSDEARRFFSESAERFMDGVDMFDYGPAADRLTELGARTVTIRTADGDDAPTIKVHRRAWDGREVIYVANISRDPVEARLSFECDLDGTVEEWDLSTGGATAISPCVASDAVDLDLKWWPRQARAFVCVPSGDACSAVAPAVKLTDRGRLAPEWSGKRTGPNVLLLDACRFVEGQRIGALRSVSDARSDLAGSGSDAPSRLTARFPFNVSKCDPTESACEVAVEFGNDPGMRFNGEAVAIASSEWVMDPAVRKVALPPLRAGENALDVCGQYDTPTDLESPWLLGDFRVSTADSVAFVVERDDGPIGIGSWPSIGMPFYAGTVTYTASVEIDSSEQRVMLDISGLAGSAEVRVGGRVVDHVLWPPYRCDLTGHVVAGKNVIEIEVANTLRNLFGAHFNYEESRRAGISIASYAGLIGQKKQFVDYGLLKAPELVLSEVG